MKKVLAIAKIVFFAVLFSMIVIVSIFAVKYFISTEDAVFKVGELELLEVNIENYKTPIRTYFEGKDYLKWDTFNDVVNMYGYHYKEGEEIPSWVADYVKNRGAAYILGYQFRNSIVLFPNFIKADPKDGLYILTHELLHSLIGQTFFGQRFVSADGVWLEEGVVDYYAVAIMAERGFRSPIIHGYPSGRHVTAYLVQHYGDDVVLKAACAGELDNLIDEIVEPGYGGKVNEALALLARNNYQSGSYRLISDKILDDFYAAVLEQDPEINLDYYFAWYD